jgi:hypothetical protein
MRSSTGARCADLLPDYLSQRLIDLVLPARSGFLKVIKNVPREVCGLRGCRLERRRLNRSPAEAGLNSECGSQS